MCFIFFILPYPPTSASSFFVNFRRIESAAYIYLPIYLYMSKNSCFFAEILPLMPTVKYSVRILKELCFPLFFSEKQSSWRFSNQYICTSEKKVVPLRPECKK